MNCCEIVIDTVYLFYLWDFDEKLVILENTSLGDRNFKEELMNDFLQKANSPFMYLIGAAVVLFIIVQSFVFLIRAYRRGIKIGMDPSRLRRAATSSAIFTVIPSIGILLGVIAMSGSLGVPLPWIRLSVIGALHYELMAADVAGKAAGLTSLSAASMTDSAFVTIAFVMTIGIIWGGLFCIFGLKKYQNKLTGVSQKDNKWGQIMFNAMFIGMVCAYIASSFGDLAKGSVTGIIVIIVSALSMALFTWITKKTSAKWLESFALSFSMLIGMASAILIG